MLPKRIVIGLFCATLLLGAILFYVIENKALSTIENFENESAKNIEVPIHNIKKEAKEVELKYDLYSSTPYEIPLFSIFEISKITPQAKKYVDEILDLAQGFYFLKYDENESKIIALLQNPVIHYNTYNRHDLQYVEIFSDGRKVYHMAGYNGIEDEINNGIEQKNDHWDFDKSQEPYRPLKHIAYDEKGKPKFYEYWDYSSKNPIKYYMKDNNKKIVSMIKESQDNESNFRREHIFYDNNGNITMSLRINYDDANITRFTYYNSHDFVESISIISEYENGLKTKESIYDQNYQLVKTLIPEYINDERKSITIYNKDNIKIAKISA